MEAEKRARFQLGPQVTGASFFGRRRERERLRSYVTECTGSLSLVGPTRIGKSSLVAQLLQENPKPENQLRVTLVMGEFEDAQAFWKRLFWELCRKLKQPELLNDVLQEDLELVNKLKPDEPSWFSRYNAYSADLFEQISEAGWSVLLVVDEFDGAARVFGQEVAYYQRLRSICSDPSYSVCCILISRRRLSLMEKNTVELSSFHGVFNEIALKPFSEDDMDEVWAALEQNGITLTDEAKQEFLSCTGRLPYLCSMFCSCMVDELCLSGVIGPEKIRAAFEACLPQIDAYYENLTGQLKLEGALEYAKAISIGLRPPQLDQRSEQSMRTLGELVQPENGEAPYFFTRDYMIYLREKPISIPIWDTITGCEKKLKAILQTVYPELGTVSYRELCTNRDPQGYLDQVLPELHFKWETVDRSGKTLKVRKPDASVLDTMTLSFVVEKLLARWERFYSYFPDGDSVRWKNQLRNISDLRNTIAHGHMDCISDHELQVLQRCCEEVMALEL